MYAILVAMATTLALAGPVAAGAVPPAGGVIVDCTNGADLNRSIESMSRGETIAIMGTCRGPVTITQDITLEGIGEDATLLGNSDATLPLMTITPGASVVVRNLALTGNHSEDVVGGAIANRGTLLLDGVRIVDNSAHRCGAGSNSGTMEIRRSVIERNSAAHRVGGLCNTGSLIVRETTLQDNWAESIGQIRSDGDLRIIDSTLSRGVAGDTGESAIYSSGSLTISGSTIEDHVSTGDGTILHTGALLIADSTVRRNRGYSCVLRVSGSARIVDSDLDDNFSEGDVRGLEAEELVGDGRTQWTKDGIVCSPQDE